MEPRPAATDDRRSCASWKLRQSVVEAPTSLQYLGKDGELGRIMHLETVIRVLPVVQDVSAALCKGRLAAIFDPSGGTLHWTGR